MGVGHCDQVQGHVMMTSSDFDSGQLAWRMYVNYGKKLYMSISMYEYTVNMYEYTVNIHGAL